MEDTGKTIALIKALSGGGGGLPPVTESDNGKVLTIENGELAKSYIGTNISHHSAVGVFYVYDSGIVYSYGVRNYRQNYQVIPITYENGSFSTNVKTANVSEGDVNNADMPPFDQSSITYAEFNGTYLMLYPATIDLMYNLIDFQSAMLPLDTIGMIGYVGYLYLHADRESGDYYVNLNAWEATSM